MALDIAQQALEMGEVPVGCVFVRNDVVLAEGRNDTNNSFNATRHAEFLAIDKVLASHDKSIFKGT